MNNQEFIKSWFNNKARNKEVSIKDMIRSQNELTNR